MAAQEAAAEELEVADSAVEAMAEAELEAAATVETAGQATEAADSAA